MRRRFWLTALLPIAVPTTGIDAVVPPMWYLPAGKGILAVWWRDSLRLIGTKHIGESGESVAGIASSSPPRQLLWSNDGHWLAVLMEASLWIVSDDGRAKALPAAVVVVDGNSQISWANNADSLIVTSRRGFSVVSANGNAQQHFIGNGLFFTNPGSTFFWNTTGQLVDYAFGVRRYQKEHRDEIVLARFDTNGERPALSPVLRSQQNEGLALAGILNRSLGEVLLWSNPGFGADVSGGLPLYVASSNKNVKVFDRSFPTAAWLKFAPDRSFIAVVGGVLPIAEAWAGKALWLCKFNPVKCDRVTPSANDAELLDPVISDRGEVFAVQVGAKPREAIASQSDRTGWLNSGLLAIIESGHARIISSAGRGIASPAVERDGSSVLYLTSEGISLLSFVDNARKLIVPAFPNDADNFRARYGYFGERPASSSLFAWNLASTPQ